MLNMRNAILIYVLCATTLVACQQRSGMQHQAAVGAIGPYSGSVSAAGLCFLAGKIAPESAASGSFEQEVTGVIDAIVDELAAVGLKLDDVVSSTVYLTDMTQFAAFNHVYAQRFAEPYPARTTVGVASLPAGRRIEIAVVAARPGRR